MTFSGHDDSTVNIVLGLLLLLLLLLVIVVVVVVVDLNSFSSLIYFALLFDILLASLDNL